MQICTIHILKFWKKAKGPKSVFQLQKTIIKSTAYLPAYISILYGFHLKTLITECGT